MLRALPPDDRITLVGFRLRWIPPGAPGVLSCTVPWNPSRLVTVMLSVVEDPGIIARLLGLAEITRWVVTVRIRIVFWVVPPPEPWTVIV